MNKKYIGREGYLNKILPFMGKDVIKVITGQRRVGKSFFLLQIMDELKEHGVKKEDIVYINKELHEFDFIQTYNDLSKYIKREPRNNKKKYVFIDEIQEVNNPRLTSGASSECKLRLS